MSHKKAEAFVGWLSLGLPGSLEKIMFHMDWVRNFQLHSLAPSEGFHKFLGTHASGQRQEQRRMREGRVQRDRILIQIKGSCDVRLSGVIPITLILEFGREEWVLGKNTVLGSDTGLSLNSRAHLGELFRLSKNQVPQFLHPLNRDNNRIHLDVELRIKWDKTCEVVGTEPVLGNGQKIC